MSIWPTTFPKKYAYNAAIPSLKLNDLWVTCYKLPPSIEKKLFLSSLSKIVTSIFRTPISWRRKILSNKQQEAFYFFSLLLTTLRRGTSSQNKKQVNNSRCLSYYVYDQKETCTKINHKLVPLIICPCVLCTINVTCMYDPNRKEKEWLIE